MFLVDYYGKEKKFNDFEESLLYADSLNEVFILWFETDQGLELILDCYKDFYNDVWHSVLT